MNKDKRVHFIGVGGIGMSGLARILALRGMAVSGSDLSANGAMVRRLQIDGVEVSEDQSGAFDLTGVTVVYSSAVKEDNPELMRAKADGCDLLHRADLLAKLMEGTLPLLVAGTHGKTTTTSLLAHLLVSAGMDPSYAVGGFVQSLGANSGHGAGEYFVAEADESDGSFLKYRGHGAILTGIDADHMDFWKSEEALESGFRTFMRNISSKEHFFWCFEDEWLKRMNPEGISYGFHEGAQLRGLNLRYSGWKMTFDCAMDGHTIEGIEVPMTGRHNALNALACVGMAMRLGVSDEAICSGLKAFKGAGRRSENKGCVKSIDVIDDYAHHPTEVKALLKGLRPALNGRRLVLLLQPHRYSRTHQLMEAFAQTLALADLSIVTDVFAAGEAPIEGVSGEALAKGRGVYIPRDVLVEEVAALLRPHDVVLTVGAGDITRVGSQLLDHLKQNALTRFKVGLVAGGRSHERAISLISAKHVAEALSDELYDVSTIDVDDSFEDYDLIFPMLHGPFGEDGTLQGLCEFKGIPYVGSGHTASALCMDKARAKWIAKGAGIATAPFVEISELQWDRERDCLLRDVKEAFTLPFFVKPSHSGSSIGLTKVNEWDQFTAAMECAFKVDTHVVIEEAVVGRELEFAVMGNAQVDVPAPGELLTAGRVYDYALKYGENPMESTVNAQLEPQVLEEGRRSAETLYRAFGCAGWTRIDFFLSGDGQWIFNEANPIPGCTPISLFPQIWQREGVSHAQLVDRLVILGLERYRRGLRQK